MSNLGTALKDLYALEAHFGMRSALDNGLLDIIDELRLAGGVCELAQVNDCEAIADFTEESTGIFDITLDAANHKIGSGAIILTATTGAVGDKIYTTLINGSALPPAHPTDGVRTMDWRKYDRIGGWSYGNSTGYATATELEVALLVQGDNGSTWSDGIALNRAPVASVHRRWEADISGLTRNRVIAVGFINQNANVGETVTIDEIEVFKFSNGKGPVRGPCIWLPIKTGITIAQGNITEYEASTTHRCDLEAAAGVETLGPCVIGGTGVANGSVLACHQVGGVGFLEASAATVSGEGLEWAAGHTVAGVATDVEENAFAKGLEAAGAQYDDIAAIMLKMGSFIS